MALFINAIQPRFAGIVKIETGSNTHTARTLTPNIPTVLQKDGVGPLSSYWPTHSEPILEVLIIKLKEKFSQGFSQIKCDYAIVAGLENSRKDSGAGIFILSGPEYLKYEKMEIEGAYDEALELRRTATNLDLTDIKDTDSITSEHVNRLFIALNSNKS